MSFSKILIILAIGGLRRRSQHTPLLINGSDGDNQLSVEVEETFWMQQQKVKLFRNHTKLPNLAFLCFR